jgi:hypothetical protein
MVLATLSKLLPRDRWKIFLVTPSTLLGGTARRFADAGPIRCAVESLGRLSARVADNCEYET